MIVCVCVCGVDGIHREVCVCVCDRGSCVRGETLSNEDHTGGGRNVKDVIMKQKRVRLSLPVSARAVCVRELQICVREGWCVADNLGVMCAPGGGTSQQRNYGKDFW